jgi:predicted flap endonuclease-1-like 5' DNA nuclease
MQNTSGNNPNRPGNDPSGGSASHDAASLKHAAGAEVEGARQAARDTGSDLSEKAGELAGEAKHAVAAKANEARHSMSDSLKVIGGALRAAGDHLSENGQRGPSKIVDNVASGVDRFADSLENKPFGEVVDDLRTMGRNNAGGLFAGSMLVGLALGRLFRADSDNGGDSSRPQQPATSPDTPSATPAPGAAGSRTTAGSPAGSDATGRRPTDMPGYAP